MRRQDDFRVRVARYWLVAGFGLSCGGAGAQPDSTPSPAGFGSIEEVMVTARRVEESLQDTPISITAISATEMRNRNISRLDEIAPFTPNLMITSAVPVSGSSSSASFFIRGIGQTDFLLTTDPGVGLYVDGVYVPRSVGSLLDLVDIEQVEVLRGPQGTLFGRNTIGGAINITTVKPAEDFSGSLEASVGRYDRRDVSGTINIPLTDTVFLKATAARQLKDESVSNPLPGEPGQGDVDASSGRVSLRALPHDRITLDFSADMTRRRELPAPFVLVATNDFSPFNLVWNSQAGAGCSPPPPSTSNPACQSAYYLAGPYKSYSVFRSPSEVANQTIFFEPESKTDVFGASATLQYEHDRFSLKYIAAYRDVESGFPRDAAHSPHFIFKQMNSYDYEQQSHEVQLLGDALEERLSWLVGFYYADEEGEHLDVTSSFLVDFQSGGAVNNTSQAVFGQLNYDLTARTTLTAGLRWTEDDKSFTPDQYILQDNGLGMALTGRPLPPGLPLLPPGNYQETFEKVTPLVSVTHALTSDVNAYISYSEGFKSGGFQQRAFPPLPEVPTFDPETAVTYEIGLKSTLFDNRLRANAAVFYTDYEDLQVDAFTGAGVTITRNAAKARIRGLELEGVFAPIENLSFQGSLGLIDAEYVEIDPGVEALGIERDNAFANTPEASASLSMAYTFELAGLGTLTPRMDYSYRSETFTRSENYPISRQGGFGLLNASINFRNADGWLSATLGARNLTDKTYLITAYDATNGVIGAGEAAYSRQREWYLTLRAEF